MFDFEQKSAQAGPFEEAPLFKSTELTCEYLGREINPFVEDREIIFSFPEKEKSFYSETPQEFIEYLDNFFKPEIDLSEQQPYETAPVGTKESKVNIFYRGQKNNFLKGKNAERKDVIHKTLLRGVIRFLWEKFTAEHDVSGMTKSKAKAEYQKSLRSFIEKYFFSTSSSVPERTSECEYKDTPISLITDEEKSVI